MECIHITWKIYQQIIDTIGAEPIESGGVLAIKEEIISDYYFDLSAGVGCRFYRPSSHQITNKVNTWIADGKKFAGFVHSHPAPYIHLSGMDIAAAEKTALVNNLSAVYMAILCEGTLYFYKVTPQKEKEHPTVQSCTLKII